MPQSKPSEQASAMTPDAASRIQSSQAKSGGDMSGQGFAARAQSGAAKNENTGYTASGHQGQQSSGGNQGKK